MNRGNRKDTRQQHAESTADAVDGPYIERVVDLESLPQQDGAVADCPADEADHDRRARVHEARGRGDGHLAGDGARNGSDDAW